MLTELCVYTIKHSDDLRATLANGGRGTYTERKKWVTAKKILDGAKRTGWSNCLAESEAASNLRGMRYTI